MTTLLVLLCQSTVLLALGFLTLHLTQKRGPAVQTLVGRATLCGVALLVLLLPLSGCISSVWRVPALRQEPTPARSSPALPKREGQKFSPMRAQQAAPMVMPAASEPLPAVASSLPAAAPAAAGSAIQEGAGATKGAASSAPTPTSSVSTPTRPSSFPNPSFRKDPATEARGRKAVGLPTLLLLLWLAVCQWHLIRLRRAASPVPDGPAALLAKLTPMPPALLTHPSVHSPFLAGIRRPAIFLPPAFAADFGPDALRAVFLHEMAHRDRQDNLWTLAARLLTAVLWFQPLLWLLGRKLEQISEDACDAAVLAAHCPPRAYAACLLSLAECPPLAHSQRTLTAGVAPFRSSVGRRISRILILGVPVMPAVTLRLRLSIAALTVAAATGGAFLVSSAPAQTQPKPASVVGIWLGPDWGGQRSALIFSKDGQIDMVGSWPANNSEISHWQGTYTASGSHMTWRLTHVQVGGDAPAYATDPTLRDIRYQLSGDTLTMHLNAKHGWTQIYHRTAAYTPEMLGITPNAAPATPASADSHLTVAQRMEYAAQENDMTHLEVIGLAITEYAENHNERLPDADHWMDQIQPYLSQPGAYCDPFRPGPKQHGYAFNRNCSQQLLTAFPKPNQTVIVFDSPFAARNASNTGQTVRTWNKPTDKALIPGSGFLFVNGVAHWYGPDVHPSFLLQGGQPTALSESQMRAKADNLIKHYPGNLQIYGTSNNGNPVLLGATKPNQQLNQAQFLAGLTAVQGPGVVVTLRDSKRPFPYPKGFPAGMPPPNIIHDSDINQVVNELKAAGAEAVAVNNQRLVATSAVRCAGPTVYVNNTAQAPPFVIKAIGDPKTLAGTLTIPGGVGTMLKAYDKAMFTVQQAATLTLPAYTGKGEMRYAKPVSEPDPIQAKLDFLHKVEAAHKQHLLAYGKRVILTLDDKGSYFLDGVQLPESQIEPFLAARARQNPNLTAVIQAARNQPYSRVVKLLDLTKQAGIHSFFIAPPASSGAQSASLPSALPKRSFVVNFWVPSIGTHAVQVYVIDATGRHLASAKAYRPGTKVNLPVQAVGRSVSFQIYDNGRLTKTQQIASGSAAPTSSSTSHQAQVRNEIVKFRDKTRAKLAGDQAMLDQDEARFQAELRQALPQADAATLTKASNLESGLGGLVASMQFIHQLVEHYAGKHYSSASEANKYAQANQGHLETIAARQAQIKPLLAEEAHLFPMTAQSQQHLAQVHTLAIKAHMTGINVMVDTMQLHALDQRIGQR